MNKVFITALSLVFAVSLSAAVVTNAAPRRAALAPDKNDPLELEYQKLIEADEAAQAQVEQWIQEDKAFQEKGAGSPITLRGRIQQRLEPVRKAYEDFLQHHPGHARARLAYGSFLNDTQEEEAAQAQWEKARELDPRNPAAWNNLANLYGHNGDALKAMEYYTKALELDPKEPVYLQNFATTVYLFRREATNFFNCTEPQVFDKALALYRRAMALDPENFLLATDYAQSYYGITPPKSGEAATDRQALEKHTDEALAAWLNALKLARDDIERQGVCVHLARFQINAGRLDGARKNLDSVTNAMFSATKKALFKKLEGKSRETNAPNVKAEAK